MIKKLTISAIRIADVANTLTISYYYDSTCSAETLLTIDSNLMYIMYMYIKCNISVFCVCRSLKVIKPFVDDFVQVICLRQFQ